MGFDIESRRGVVPAGTKTETPVDNGDSFASSAVENKKGLVISTPIRIQKKPIEMSAPQSSGFVSLPSDEDNRIQKLVGFFRALAK